MKVDILHYAFLIHITNYSASWYGCTAWTLWCQQQSRQCGLLCHGKR